MRKRARDRYNDCGDGPARGKLAFVIPKWCHCGRVFVFFRRIKTPYTSARWSERAGDVDLRAGVFSPSTAITHAGPTAMHHPPRLTTCNYRPAARPVPRWCWPTAVTRSLVAETLLHVYVVKRWGETILRTTSARRRFVVFCNFIF